MQRQNIAHETHFGDNDVSKTTRPVHWTRHTEILTHSCEVSYVLDCASWANAIVAFDQTGFPFCNSRGLNPGDQSDADRFVHRGNRDHDFVVPQKNFRPCGKAVSQLRVWCIHTVKIRAAPRTSLTSTPGSTLRYDARPTRHHCVSTVTDTHQA